MNFNQEFKTHFLDIDWVSGGHHITIGYSMEAVIVIGVLVYLKIRKALSRKA